jgi:hypothetical protein
MNYLLHGFGASQTWIATCSAEALVERYEEFLHGNPYRERKVVLSRALLERNQLTPVKVTAESEMRRVVMEALERECQIARSAKAPVLLLLFSHGDENTFGLELGNSSLLTIKDVHRVVNDEVSLTVISTACFSGGWSASLLNATSSTAAGTETPSESWPTSPSLRRRHCGSIYASALIKVLSDMSSPLLERRSQEDPSAGSLQPQSPTEIQTESFNEFARTIYDSLLSIDRFRDTHEISFSAQDDDWGSSWIGRSGIPLSSFAKRWDELEKRPSTETSMLD